MRRGGKAASPGGLTRGAAPARSGWRTRPWAGCPRQQPQEPVTAVSHPGKPQLDPVVPNSPEPSSAFRIFVNDVDCPIALKNGRGGVGGVTLQLSRLHVQGSRGRFLSWDGLGTFPCAAHQGTEL